MNRSRFRPRNTFDATGRPTGKRAYDSGSEHPLQPLRDRILHNVLIAAIIFGILAFIATLPPRLASRQYILIGIFAASLLTVIIVTLSKQAPYKVRVFSFLGLISLLGISTLISDGLSGNGRVFLLALPIIAALLISERAALFALVISIAVVALSGALMLLHVIPAPGLATGTNNINMDLRYWILAVAVWVLVGSVTTVSLVAMLRGMRNLVDTEKRLRLELDSERASMTTRIQDRTRDLERRLNQIRAAADISRSLGAVLEPGQLLDQFVEQLQRNFDLYFAGVYLVDEGKEFAVLAAGSGETGSRMIAEGHQLSLSEDSTVAWSIVNQLPKIAFDVGRDSTSGGGSQGSTVQTSVVRFNNPLLPFTRSELILPIIITRTEEVQDEQHTEPLSTAATRPSPAISRTLGTHVLGALVIQSTRSQAFDKEDLYVLQGITTSLANALENANLFQQIQKNLLEIRTLNRQYLEQAWSIKDQGVQTGKLTAESEDHALLKKKQSPIGAEEFPTWVSVQVPLEVRDQVIGHLELESPSRVPDTTQFSIEDQAMINTIVTEAALALENIRLLETTQRRAGFDRLLAEITSAARSGVDLDAILRSTIRELGQALNASEAEISLQITSENPEEFASGVESEEVKESVTEHSNSPGRSENEDETKTASGSNEESN